MTIYNFLELLGGLALFLFGMHILGDGLTTISGGKAEQLLERLSSTKFKGLLLGIVVTAVIQSSSATTVMAVALVNSGVMRLRQVVPIIMGANIGTTITGWILSLTGISGDSFWIQILKPTTFTPILAAIGIILIFASKSDSKKNIGSALLGFSVLMYGMNAMSASVSPLQTDPNYRSAFQIFTNPLIGIVVGALLTAVLQSSSAMTGILQALSTTGAITFASAIPLIMGQNIGTCVTAILASIGAGKNAKRTSIVHLSFNVLGTIVFMALFYIIHALIPFSFYNDAMNEVSIAIVHTIFNVVTVSFLFPFSDQLVKLSKVIIPRRETKIKEDDLARNLRLLDFRFLSRPGFAVEQAYVVINKMMETANMALKNAIHLLFEFEPEEYFHVEMLENQVDQYEDALMEYTMKITSNALNKSDNHKLTIMMHTLNDIERISDHAINIADEAKAKAQSKTLFSDEAMEELKLYTAAVEDIMEKTRLAMKNLDVTKALEVQPLEEHIDQINKRLADAHVERLKTGVCKIENGIIISNIYNGLERIADHCYNIAIYIIQFSEFSFRQHDFEQRYDRSNPHYKDLLEQYKGKYPIPAKKSIK